MSYLDYKSEFYRNLSKIIQIIDFLSDFYFSKIFYLLIYLSEYQFYIFIPALSKWVCYLLYKVCPAGTIRIELVCHQWCIKLIYFDLPGSSFSRSIIKLWDLCLLKYFWFVKDSQILSCNVKYLISKAI